MNAMSSPSCNSSPESLVDQAIHLNNEGVAFLSTGNYHEARRRIQGALALFRQACHEGTFTPPIPLSAMAPSGCCLAYAALSAPLQINAVPIPGINREDELFCFDRGLWIAAAPSGANPNMITSLHIGTSIALFNLALHFHARARSAQRASSPFLTRALDLYRLCIDSCITCQDRTYETIGSLLQVLAENNCANIHADWCEFDEAREAMHEVGLVLQTDATHNLPSQLEECILDGLALNMMQLSYPMAGAAAA